MGWLWAGVWATVWVLTIPCLIAHAGIILSVILSQRLRRPPNYLVANLSLATIINQVAVGIISLEKYVDIWPPGNFFCSLRSVAFRMGIPMISFTLTRMVIERSHVSRNLLHVAQKKSSILSLVAISLLSFVILCPLGLMRTYDPNTQRSVKCVKTLLLDNLILDCAYRILLLFVVHLIPAVILFRELVRMLRLLRFLGTIQVSQVQHGELTKQRIRLMRNSCVYIFMFVSYSLPYGLLDSFDSPAIPISKELTFYIIILREIAFILGYIVITVNPIIMFYINFFKPQESADSKDQNLLLHH